MEDFLNDDLTEDPIRKKLLYDGGGSLHAKRINQLTGSFFEYSSPNRTPEQKAQSKQEILQLIHQIRGNFQKVENKFKTCVEDGKFFENISNKQNQQIELFDSNNQEMLKRIREAKMMKQQNLKILSLIKSLRKFPSKSQMQAEKDALALRVSNLTKKRTSLQLGLSHQKKMLSMFLRVTHDMRATMRNPPDDLPTDFQQSGEKN